jgi:hypothetical protein
MLQSRKPLSWPLRHLYPYELLSGWTGEPEKVCLRAMERADEHDLLWIGVSLRTASLSDKGREFLEGVDILAEVEKLTICRVDYDQG